MKQNFYIISVSGWEEYSPIWLTSILNKEEFRSLISKLIDDIVNELVLKNDDSIDGHDILNKLIEVLEQNNIHQVNIEDKIDISGSCYYSKSMDEIKPDIFSNESWDKIIQHNEKLHDEFYNRDKKELNNDNGN